VDLSRPVPATTTRRGGFWPTAPQREWWHHAIGLPVVVLLGWYAFVRGTRVPVLGWIDLAVHEFGHVAFAWLPRAGMLTMGSGTQVMVPLLVAAGLWWRSRDRLGAALALGWAATSTQDASVYIADAPYQRLPLIGGVHDWGTLLGPHHLDAMWAAEDLARLVWASGLLLWVVAVAVLVTEIVRLRGTGASGDGPSGASSWDTDDDPPTTWSLPAS
jgi:hypothetical protein